MDGVDAAPTQTGTRLARQVAALRAQAEAAADVDARARTLGRVARLLLLGGRTAEGLDQLDAARLLPASAGAQADLRLVAARAYAWTGRSATALQTAEAALADLVSLRAPLAEAELDLAAVYVEAGRARAARALAQGVTEPDLLRPARLIVALSHLVEGDATRAMAALRPVLVEARGAGDPLAEAEAYGLLGRALLDLRDYPRARATLDTALRAAKATGQQRVAAAALGGLGLCRIGESTDAASLAEGTSALLRCVALCEAIDDPAAESAWRAHLDDALSALDRPEQRARELRRWIVVVRRLGNEGLAASMLETLAAAHLAFADAAGARAALVEAEAAWRSVGQAKDAERVAKRLAAV